MITRGLRNNNPGNIRITGDKWKGLREVQTDKEFFQFKEMKWGYRALMVTLRNYRNKHKCITLKDFIYRWAPPTENNSASYLNSVCKRLQVPTDFVPNVCDAQTMCQIAAAISYHENGVEADMNDVYDGWLLMEGAGYDI